MILIYFISSFLFLHSILGQISILRCPSDSVASAGCPNGWFSYSADCYQFNTIQRLNYIDATRFCNTQGGGLLRIQDLTQHKFFADLLNKNAINKSIPWYTSGFRSSAKPNKFSWEGYPVELKEFNSELFSLLVEKPDQTEKVYWNKDRVKIVYVYDNMQWRLNLTITTEEDYFICQASKSIISKVVTMVRTAEYGQNDLSNIRRGPCITQQPTDQLFVPTVSNLEAVTFTCGVYGNPNPSISWYMTIGTSKEPIRKLINPLDYPNGQVSQTGGFLTFINPNNSFDHKIDCQATNDFGTVMSKQVQIIRGQLGVYNKNPRQEKIIFDNTGFLLDCEAPQHSPEDSLTYTFYIQRVNDKGMSVDDVIQPQLRQNIFLSLNLGLIGFSIASEKDSGIYRCMLGWKGLSGTSYKSPDIPLTVKASNTPYPFPTINDKFPNFRPSNPFLGDTLEFECFGYGEIRQNPLKYYWKWNGRDLPKKAKISDFDRRMQLVDVQFEDEGNYSCSIESYDGRVSEARKIVLTINAKPTFIGKPTNQYPDIGSTANMSCEAIGRPQVEIKWYRNDELVTKWLASNPDPRYNVSEGNVSKSVLTITDIKITDNAMFGCVISNNFGRESSFIEFKAQSIAPNFNKYPLLNTEAILDNNIILQGQPEGSPTPNIVWKFNGGQINPSLAIFSQEIGAFDCGGKYCKLPNNNLFIKKVNQADKGTYSCTATNIRGTATSSAYLDVIETLKMTNSLVSRRVEVNSNVYLPCQASGTPYLDIDYDWYFENVQIKFDRMDMDARRYDKSQFTRPYNRYFGTMTISNIQFYDEGNYTCRITTPFNSIDRSGLIQVLGPPGFGGGISISPSNMSHVVEWTDGFDRGKPITWYKLEVTREQGRREWYPLRDRINKTDVTIVVRQNKLKRNQYMFSELPANTNFRLRISAANDFGLGSPSSPSEVFKTPAIPPVKIPLNVTGGGGKVGTLVIRWEPLNSLDENGDKFIYDIKYKEEKELEWIEVSNPLNKSLDNDKYRQVTIDLPIGKDYIPFNVQVRAANEKGSGPWSPTSTITSASKLPSYSPQNVDAGSFNSTAISVSWDAPEIGKGEGPIKGYHIVYWMRFSDCRSQAASKDRLKGSQRLTLYGEKLKNGIIIGLTADRYYCIAVQMFNSAGDSLDSRFVDQTTFKKPPQNFPTIMRLNSTNTPHQIRVTWNGVRVMAEEESVDGYKMRYWLSGAPVRTALDVDVGLKVTGLLKNIQYDVRYNLRIFAYSRGGHGKLSNPMDQFMMIPRDRCQSDTVYEGTDVRYIFVCSSCRYLTSMGLVIVGLLVAKFII